MSILCQTKSLLCIPLILQRANKGVYISHKNNSCAIYIKRFKSNYASFISCDEKSMLNRMKSCNIVFIFFVDNQKLLFESNRIYFISCNYEQEVLE